MIQHAVDGLMFFVGAVLIGLAIVILGFLGRRLLDGVAFLAELVLDKWRNPPPP